MTKPSQTPSKTKSSSKPSSKSKVEKAKPKKSVKSTITSKSTKVKATSRKLVKREKPVDNVVAKGELAIKVLIAQGEPAIDKDALVKPSPSKLKIFVAEQFMAEKEGKKETGENEGSDESTYSLTDEEEDEETNKGGEVEGEKGHDSEVKKSEDEGESAKENEEEEKGPKREGDSESEDNDHEGVGDDEKESEGKDSESETEEENESEESEGSMTIENTIMALLEEVNEKECSEELRPSLTPFLGDEEVESDEDDLPLFEVRKKKKASAKLTKTASRGKREVAPPTRTPLTRSKRKVVNEKLIKEARSTKRIMKSVAATETVVKLDEDDELSSSHKGKKLLVMRTAIKPIKATAPTSQKKIIGKKKNIKSEAVDGMAKFKSRKVLNGKILANTDEKGMA
ncbi:uncharacterized protein [Nicotiana tomentosiformis]|uniref:uncharacterized protein n=1 Tax=Nicotiana tomentosiformis TaxID=4098 RepID=UPI00388C582A